MTPAELAALLGLPELDEALAAVEVMLDGTLAVDRPEIEAPARRVVLGGGKRLRPTVSLASAAAVSGDQHATVDPMVVAGATAVELIQAGSLVHDDIMDSADERRGVPTVNAVEGANQALLVGDYLLARAGQLAAGINAAAAGFLATAITDLCVGQSAELVTMHDADRSIDAYMESIAGKTAALFRASCEIAAAAIGADEDATRALARYGTEFGLAFQIVDDVLDLVSTTEALGKPAGNDIREGVYSLPVLLALEGPDGEALRSRLGPAIDEDDVVHALTLVRNGTGPRRALDAARDHNRRAVEALAALPPGPVTEGLARLPDAYLDWVLADKAPRLDPTT